MLPGRQTRDRVLLFLLSIPGFYLIIFVLDFSQHLVFSACTVAAAAAAAVEARRLTSAALDGPRRPWVVVGAASLPAAAYLEAVSLVPMGSVEAWLAALVIASLAGVMLPTNQARLETSLARAAGSLLVLVYPGWLLSFVVRTTAVGHPQTALLLLICVVYGNDSLAWLGGRLTGSATRLGLLASPRKTLTGYLAGIGGSVAATFLIRCIWRSQIVATWGAVVGFGVALGMAAAAGDLAESALKRAAAVKDSGVAIPGRGGILDSIDSVLFAAPVFYYLYPLIEAA